MKTGIQTHIDLAALSHNYHFLQGRAPGAELMAVVKADGYGHGMVAIASHLQGLGCRCFGVSDLAEALVLRRHGVAGRIVLLLGADASQWQVLREHDLELVIYDESQLAAFCAISGEESGRLAIHLKVDCGMTRLGFSPEKVASCCALLQKCPSLNVVGLMSHLPCADGDLVLTKAHNRTFADLVTQVRQAGFAVAAHIANSAALLGDAQLHWDMVRPGIALYGYQPGGTPAGFEGELQPVMTVTAPVLQVKDVAAGTGISYGLTKATSRPSRLAVVAAGYGEGYSRILSGQGEILIRGQRAPIMGRVCMGMTVVDVTDIPGAVRNDTAVLLGRQGDEAISADEIALWLGTISYEVLCMLGKSNKRSFING
ncbi:MAG: alanine racemase [Thermodesulfobacteriota bacterium]